MKIIFLEDKTKSNHKKTEEQMYYTPIVVSDIDVGVHKLCLKYKKIGDFVEVYVSINEKNMGCLCFSKKSDFSRLPLTHLSYSPYSIFGVPDIITKEEWAKALDFDNKNEFAFGEVEETITFYTLFSLIELNFPTNWLLLLP